MNKNTAHKIFICLLIICMLCVACNQTQTSKNNPSDLNGTITISGAWALYPLMVRWGEEFQAIYPGVRFDISAGGAGKGMADVLSGAVDIGMVSREIHPEEIQKGAFWVPVTKDAVFLTISQQNPVFNELHQQGISREALIGIYITADITTWGQVVGRPEILEPIHVYTRSDACGAAETWAMFLGGRQEDLIGIGVYGDPGVLDAVIKDPLGIGYNNLNYVYDFDSGDPVFGANVIPLDFNQNGYADNEEIYDTKSQAISAVALEYYPSPPARDLNLVTYEQPSGLTRIFLTWILTDGQAYVEEAGYIPLRESQLLYAVEKLGTQ